MTTVAELDALRREAVKKLRDEETATAVLRKTRDELAAAAERLAGTTEALRDKLIELRPLGVLTVGEMAEAIGRDRNYVDTVWSLYRGPGRADRLPRAREVEDVRDPAAALKARDDLKAVADRHARATRDAVQARQARNQAVASAYVAFGHDFGPSRIAREAGIDRNHVLRIARRAGMPAVHRRNIKNQYSK